MPNLVYSNPDFVPFTVIRSADVNQKFSDIQTLLNVTKLDDTNLQDAGITRATKLKTGTAKAIVINNDTTGAMSELISVNNGAVYFNATGVPSTGPLPLASGGIGVSLTLTNPDEVLAINSAGTAIEFKPSPVPAPLKLWTYYNL